MNHCLIIHSRSINGMSKGHENLELNRRLAKEIGRSRVVIDLFKEEVS